MVFHISTPRNPKARFKVSHLCYALIKQPQYETTVKLLGSFRLTAGRGHLHPHCIFTEQVLETVSQSLRLSCTSELHVRQYYIRTTVCVSLITKGVDYIFISTMQAIQLAYIFVYHLDSFWSHTARWCVIQTWYGVVFFP